MSRIGKKPIALPAGVKVTINGQQITVEGPKGKLSRLLHALVSGRVADREVLVERKDESREARSLHGLTATLISNMVAGVVTPFKRSLEISGVGYRAELQGAVLRLQVGLSHD